MMSQALTEAKRRLSPHQRLSIESFPSLVTWQLAFPDYHIIASCSMAAICGVAATDAGKRPSLSDMFLSAPFDNNNATICTHIIEGNNFWT
jgi:hypothetical protein